MKILFSDFLSLLKNAAFLSYKMSKTFPTEKLPYDRT